MLNICNFTTTKDMLCIIANYIKVMFITVIYGIQIQLIRINVNLKYENGELNNYNTFRLQQKVGYM